jgi:hypothetical protein
VQSRVRESSHKVHCLLASALRGKVASGKLRAMQFYASDEDQLRILRWIFEKNDFSVYPSYGRYDEEMPRFSSPKEVAQFFGIGDSDRVAGTALLSLWSPEMEAEPSVYSRVLTGVPGNPIRPELKGWGLIHLHFGDLNEKGRNRSDISANSQKRARAWEETYRDEMGSAADWNWREVTRLLRRISHWIARQASSKEGSHPILPGAEKERAEGITLVGAGSRWISALNRKLFAGLIERPSEAIP